MDLKILFTVFGAVFLAELGDKTQLATVVFSAEQSGHRLTVFTGASLALIATSALGVFLGGIISGYVSPKFMSLLAGIGFILIGCWTLYRGFFGM